MLRCPRAGYAIAVLSAANELSNDLLTELVGVVGEHSTADGALYMAAVAPCVLGCPLLDANFAEVVAAVS